MSEVVEVSIRKNAETNMTEAIDLCCEDKDIESSQKTDKNSPL